jgi:hypothetical protein
MDKQKSRSFLIFSFSSFETQDFLCFYIKLLIMITITYRKFDCAFYFLLYKQKSPTGKKLA